MKSLSAALSALPVSAPLLIDRRSARLREEGRTVISFCAGDPDFDTPSAALKAASAAMEAGMTHYTDAVGTPELRQAVAEFIGREDGWIYGKENITVTSGAKYAVYAAVSALCDPGDEVILPAPYWTSYLSILNLRGCVPVVVSCAAENGFKLTPELLEAAVTPRTKALILNNPNNPSGAVYSRTELRSLADVIQKHDLYVVADEVYESLVFDGRDFCSVAALDEDMRTRAARIGGVSKTYAMTGWRIGWCAAPENISRAVGAFLSHTTGCPSSVSQAAALAALTGPQDSVRLQRECFESRRNLLCDCLKQLGVPHVRPEGTFYVLTDVRSYLNGRDDTAFALELLDRPGVAMVPGSAFGAPGWLRLCCTLRPEKIQEGMEGFACFIGKEGCLHG